MSRTAQCSQVASSSTGQWGGVCLVELPNQTHLVMLLSARELRFWWQTSQVKSLEINRIFPVWNGSGGNSLDEYLMKCIKMKWVNYPKSHRRKSETTMKKKKSKNGNLPTFKEFLSSAVFHSCGTQMDMYTQSLFTDASLVENLFSEGRW